ATNSAIGRWRPSRNIIMNGRSERQTLAAKKIGFNTTGTHALCRVEMNADEDGIPIRVCDRDSAWQWHKDIAVPGHDDAITGSGKEAFEALRHIQRHLFFWNSLTGNPTPIKTTMASVDHYRCG